MALGQPWQDGGNKLAMSKEEEDPQTMTTTAATNGNKNNKTLLRTTKAHLDPATKLWNILQQKTEIESKVGVWGIMRRACY